ncbi:MAG: YraN family protein [Gemmatimonadales bacterium]|nr:YraN family protein [Gemmatimonadales bacterium]
MTRRPSPKPVAEWTDERHVLGHEGEEDAVAYFESHGWRIEARRFRLGHHDLDLVVRRGTQVAFVEVKTRKSRRYGTVLEALGHKQRRSLTRLAQVWVQRHGRPGDSYRFDLIGIDVLTEGLGRVTHVEDAWRAER